MNVLPLPSTLAAETEPPDMAVLDIRMPGVDGLTAARQLWDDAQKMLAEVLKIAFADRAAHDGYQVHPRHKQFIEENRETWEKVRVFDTQ